MPSSSRSSRVADPELSDDDLDELFSDDEDDDVDKKPDRNDISVQLKGSLKEPRFKTVNLRQLNDLIEFGDVNLNPDYQREVVWSKEKMESLIQSLFLNYYVPPVIFAVQEKEDGSGEDERVCIDGKQRCSSIMRFISGQISFKSPATGQRFYYTNFPGHNHRNLLPATLKRKFDNVSIQIVEYDDLPVDKQRDIFQRVQLGMALTAAEKLQALPGPWREWIMELQKKYVTGSGTIADRLPKFSTKRAKAFQFLVAFIMIAHSTARVVPTAATQTKFLKRVDPPEKAFRRKIEMAMSIFLEIAIDHYDEAFAGVDERVAPVEFWFTAYLIFTRMHCMSMSRLARAIHGMRMNIRGEFHDIMSNSKVSNFMFDYVDGVARIKQPGEISAVEEFEADEAPLSKKRRLEEDRDASYRDDNGGISRDALPSDVVQGLRSQKIAKKSHDTTHEQKPVITPAPPTPAPVVAPAFAPPPPPPVQQQQQQYQHHPQHQHHPQQQWHQQPAPTPTTRRPSMGMDTPNAPPPYRAQAAQGYPQHPQHPQHGGYPQHQPPHGFYPRR